MSKESNRECNRLWKIRNSAKVKESARLYRLKNKDRIREYDKKYYEDHQDKLSSRKLRNAWLHMLSRCGDPSNKAFSNYGGRGISVCAKWRDFESFREDMGEKPSPVHTVDRIDNDKGYSPENTRWATRKEQARNTRRNVFIKGKTMAEWAESLGLHYATFRHRYKKWGDASLSEGFVTPKHTRANAIKKQAEELGISVKIMNQRIRRREAGDCYVRSCRI